MITKTTDILKDIISGEINIDFNGHDFNRESLIEGVQFILDEFTELHSSLENDYADNSLVIAYKNNGFVTPDDFINDVQSTYESRHRVLFPVSNNKELAIRIEATCFNCGESSREIHYNKETGLAELYSLQNIEPMEFEYSDKEKTKVKSVKNEGKWDFLPLKKCEYSGLESIDSIINVDSNLIFRNFFLGEDDEYLKELKDDSINYTSGVKKLTDMYAEENIIYGQTGNMSVHIYQKGDELTILSSDVNDLRNDYEYCPDDYNFSDLEIEQLSAYKDWNYKGSVSCEVWRYMASSRSNLEKLNLKNDHYDDEVEVELTSGDYEMKHSYQIKDKGFIISTIKKV